MLLISELTNALPRDKELVNSNTGELYKSTPELEQEANPEEILNTILRDASNWGIT